MALTVASDEIRLAELAAERVTQLIIQAVAERGTAWVSLAGGTTPRRLYANLADGRQQWRDRIPWRQVHLFWSDERHVPPDHPDSNYGMAKAALLDRVPVPAQHVHRIRGELPDARADPAWRQQILDWYARPAGTALPEVGRGAANFYGVSDLHGLVWEWVLDLGSMMVSSDNREQGDPDLDRFCGSGALSLEEKENYAMLMRIATLSSMQASYTSSSMGFRCATDSPRTP